MLGSSKVPNPTDDWHLANVSSLIYILVLMCVLYHRTQRDTGSSVSNHTTQSMIGKKIMALRSFSVSGMLLLLTIAIMTELQNCSQASNMHDEWSRGVSKCLLSSFLSGVCLRCIQFSRLPSLSFCNICSCMASIDPFKFMWSVAIYVI